MTNKLRLALQILTDRQMRTLIVCIAMFFTQHATAVVFEEDFLHFNSYPTGTPVGDSWNTFITEVGAGAAADTFLSVTLSGSNDPEVFTCSNPVLVNYLGRALSVIGGSVVFYCDGNVWRVGQCVDGQEINVNATEPVCNCEYPGIALRPTLKAGNPNWGGFKSATCGGPSQTIKLEFSDGGLNTEDFSKEITNGNDINGQDGIDLAVEVGIQEPASYDFKINYNQPNLPPVQIEDTVPAEWQVLGLQDDSLNCDLASANKKDNGKSATKLVCLPDSTEGMVTVLVDARCHGNKRNTKCKPTSCGALYLNDGAAAYELDPDTGEPVLDYEGNRLPPLMKTNSLCLAAVSDLDEVAGIDYTGNGDEDGDSFLDHEEACELGTDPCVYDEDFDEDGLPDLVDPDIDNDGVLNDADNCNFEVPNIDLDNDGCEDPV